MKFYINGRFLSRPMTGVDRFAQELINALDNRLQNEPLPGFELEVLCPPGSRPGPWQCIPTRVVGRRGGQLWEQWDLLKASRQGFLINLCNTAPAFKREQMVVIHDATTKRVPQAFSKAFRAWYAVLMPWLIRYSRMIATVSEYSRIDIASAFGGQADKIRVLPEGAEHILRFNTDPAIIERTGLSRKPYFLAVGSVVPHKNFGLILRALQSAQGLDFNIAIAGGVNPRVFGSEGPFLHPNVIWLGYVSNEELRSLYENALGFIFPSLYEGFGLPPLEAMACGCPVIVSKTSSLPEVCGSAALYIDPHDPASLLGAMQSLAGHPDIAQGLRSAGLERVAHWTWARAAEELIGLMRVAKGG